MYCSDDSSGSQTCGDGYVWYELYFSKLCSLLGSLLTFNVRSFKTQSHVRTHAHAHAYSTRTFLNHKTDRHTAMRSDRIVININISAGRAGVGNFLGCARCVVACLSVYRLSPALNINLTHGYFIIKIKRRGLGCVCVTIQNCSYSHWSVSSG